jgi:Cft2 family RNA processing exonuclease
MHITYNSHISIFDKFKNDIFNIDQIKKDDLTKKLLISHAHSDHIVNTPQQSFLSSPTLDFINLQIPNCKLKSTILQTNKSFDLNDRIKVTPYNAGHTFGSNMFYFETKDTNILYTGDINTNDTLLLKGAKPVSADVLIIESTFGKEEFVFPDRQKIYLEFAENLARDMANNRLIIIGAYKLGKSQEIIKFVNKYLKEKPLVNESIFNNSKVYEKYSLNLGGYELLNNNIKDHNILIIPPHLITNDLLTTLEHQTSKQVSTYFVTGWKFYRKGKCIPISDHCDFNDLLEFVSAVNPRQIITMHGFYTDFAKNLNKYFKNIKVRTVDQLNKSL